MSKVIAVDFDGCLCSNEWPLIGKPNYRVIKRLLKEQRNGAKIILWSCREGDMVEKAVEWCLMFGIVFDAVNANLPERTELYKNDCRKIGADEYWDDKAITMKYRYNKWAKR